MADPGSSDSIAVICNLAARHGLQEVRLVYTPPAPPAQKRLSDHPDVLPLLEHGASLRAIESLPFWETVLLAAERAETGLPQVLADAAAYHQALDESLDLVKAVDRDLEVWMRDTVAEASAAGMTVACRSRVRRSDGTDGHIAMLDFAARTRHPGSLMSARAVLHAMQAEGRLLDSGRSFHFYGDQILDSAELGRFLGQALLFSPLVDGRWIAHQLMGSACALRISPGKSGQLPRDVS